MDDIAILKDFWNDNIVLEKLSHERDVPLWIIFDPVLVSERTEGDVKFLKGLSPFVKKTAAIGVSHNSLVFHWD